MAKKTTEVEPQFYVTASFNATISLPLKAKTFEAAIAEAKEIGSYKFLTRDDADIQDYETADIQTIYKI